MGGGSLGPSVVASDVLVAAVIPTVPGREGLLARAVASVAAQDVPAEVYVQPDPDRRGPAWARNSAALTVPSGVVWLAFLDDDDVWYPNHLSTLLAAATPEVDVVYSRARIVGEGGWDPQRFPFPADRMRQVNSLPCTGIVRRRLFVQVGGFPAEDDSPRGYEDWGLWLRLLDAGATFYGVDETTWEYRRDTTSTRHR